ncbi:MAG: hypothetical protein H0T80_00365 [Betaproteobacteria bacterium]|nr:hypothetical protein [Betaproteobacteria bacterium]MBA3775233.1 hypothetical protein [Betaproteobacteria bacterium]
MPELFTVEHLAAGYGDSIARGGVTLELDEGGSLALLGGNGVGETTLLLTASQSCTLKAFFEVPTRP